MTTSVPCSGSWGIGLFHGGGRCARWVNGNLTRRRIPRDTRSTVAVDRSTRSVNEKVDRKALEVRTVKTVRFARSTIGGRATFEVTGQVMAALSGVDGTRCTASLACLPQSIPSRSGSPDARRWVTEPVDVDGGSRLRPPRASRPFGAVAISLASLAIGACNGGGDSTATPTTVTSATAESTTSTTTVEAGVLQAYRSFWDGYLAAADPMDPESAVLAQVATGEQLRQLRSAFLARLSAGEVIRGEVDTAPVVVQVSETDAAVRDCYLDRTGVYDAKTGARKDRESGVRHLVTVALVKDTSSWKVASLKREADGCTPGATS